ncbi:DNA helicase RecQ [bacterium]|nr:DNA helicase RecQ [bacterium]MBU1615372.1 DNA helicase RecQ [bacterium]
MLTQAKTLLKNVFGYDEFRPLQGEIIENVLGKNDSLVIMPTGGGKSLCYQIPALIFDGLTIVVSPLISLMKNQVEQLRELGVGAVLLNSSLSSAEYSWNVRRVEQGEVKLLYLAPESLLKPNMLAMLSSVKVDCLAIDEAHCISEWGHDFRPEYRQLIKARSLFPEAVCVALTATATPRVAEDIRSSLALTTPNEFMASFNRENLFLEIIPKDRALEQTIKFVRKFPDESGIIYCSTRKQVDALYEVLKEEGFSVRSYHAGMSDEERHKSQDLFIRDDVSIVVATIAFGMGIDKPNVRFVLHFDLPKNIETYYQEIGRAGRDGLRSDCLLLFGSADLRTIRHFIREKEDHEQRLANSQLNAMLGFAETDVCRRIPLLNYFGEEYSAPNCNMCDNCLSPEKELVDITAAAQKFLSCMKQTGGRFGANHIINVLRGSKAQRILGFGHQDLSIYGTGDNYSRRQWSHLARQLIQKGLILQELEFGGLQLTKQAWAVLKGKEPVLGIIEEERVRETPGKEETFDYDRGLFELLRKERKSLASSANLPPYVIFSDKTLIEMTTFFPQGKESLLDIHGVGAVKYERYGQIFLDIIREYCLKHQIKEQPKETKKRAAESSETTHKQRHIIVGEMYNCGQSLDRITDWFGIKQETALDYLLKYLRQGYSLKPDGLLAASTVPPEKRMLILETFDRLGAEYLKPVFEVFDGEIGYEELKPLRLYYLSKNNPIPETSRDKPCRKQIVCLANSRKYSGHCVAGKELSDGHIGPWIRPVSEQETGELSKDEIKLQGAQPPKLLDVITVSLRRPAPHSYQRENYLTGKDAWVKNRELSVTELLGLCDDVDSLWINDYHSSTGLNDRIPEDLADEKLSSSLLFIKPDNLCIVVEQGSDSLKKVRAKFSFKGIEYSFRVTDPAIEERAFKKDLGQYRIKKEDVYLTVSLGEPYNGYCYKLVAGIVSL